MSTPAAPAHQELTPEQQRIHDLRAHAKTLATAIQLNQESADARHKAGASHLAEGYEIIAEMQIETLESVMHQLQDLGAPLDG